VNLSQLRESFGLLDWELYDTDNFDLASAVADANLSRLFLGEISYDEYESRKPDIKIMSTVKSAEGFVV